MPPSHHPEDLGFAYRAKKTAKVIETQLHDDASNKIMTPRVSPLLEAMG
jgi:hypothetical protein